MAAAAAAAAATQSTLEVVPAEIIIRILNLLPLADFLTVAEIGPGCWLGKIANDPANFRTLNLSKDYQLTAQTLRVLLSKWRKSIVHLNISNCYWLEPEDFSSLNFRLPNLQHLDIRHTNIPFRTVHTILSNTRRLGSLSYDQRYTGIKLCDISGSTVRTLRGLKAINTVCVPGRCIGPNTGCLLDYCGSELEAFGVTAGYVQDIDTECSCGRRLDDVLPFANLKHVSIGRRAPDAHPKCYYINIIQHATNQRSVSFPDGCFGPTDDTLPQYPKATGLLSLRIAHAPDDLTPFRYLRYLCITSSIDFVGLKAVAKNCRHLESLNISFCKEALTRVDMDKGWTDLAAFHIFVEAKTPLRHLNISGLHPHLTSNEMCKVLGQIPGLVSLSLPVCALPERETSVPVDGLTFGQIRHRTKSCSSVEIQCDRCMKSRNGTQKTDRHPDEGCAYCSSDLSQLVTGCCKMKSFEMIKTGFVSFLSPRTSPVAKEDTMECGDVMDPENTLLCLSRWTHLQSLVLAGVPSIFHGRSLVTIAKDCPMLTALSLAHLGPHPYDQCLFMDCLCEALTYAKSLQDFRFEQPKVIQTQLLLKGLQHCTRLKRLCLITQLGRVKGLDDVLIDVMEHCKELVALQIICGVYFETCAKWQELIVEKYKPTRPALHVLIKNYKRSELSCWRNICPEIPYVHLDELTLFQTRVATAAPTWEEVKGHIENSKK